MNYTYNITHKKHINMKTQSVKNVMDVFHFFIILEFLVPLKQPSSRPSTKDLHLFLVFHVKMMIQSQLQTSAR